MEESILVGLLKIIVINIVLSGDNAVVIAMASRNLEKKHQKLAIFWGSFGAIGLRIVLTFIAVWILKIPFTSLMGGLLLIWIAIQLLNEEEEPDLKGHSNLIAAIKTIIFADLIMSLDNVLAIAGVAQGSILLIVIGLTISIPLIIFGSQILMKLMNRFPIIVTLGAALLGYTAGEMIVTEKELTPIIDPLPYGNHIIPILLAIFVVLVGKLMSSKSNKKERQN